MITEVNMERRLFGETVLQKSKSGFFSATDLVTAGNRWRNAKRQGVFSLHGWLQYKSTIEFIEELEAKFGKVICKGQKTWIHPFLFIDLALALSPKLKIETYSWLYDHLLQNRNDSGDSYKLMSGALYAHHGCKRTFPRLMASVSLKIQDLCGVHDWQQATEAQLKERIQIHDDISIHADVLHDNEQAVRMALIHHKKKKMAEGLGI